MGVVSRCSASNPPGSNSASRSRSDYTDTERRASPDSRWSAQKRSVYFYFFFYYEIVFFLEIPSYRLACGLSLYLHIYGCLLIMQKGSKLARQSTATMTDRLVFSCMFSNGGQSVYSFFFVCVFFFCLCVCAVACVREVVFVCLLPTEWASKAGSPLYDVARYNRFTEAYNPPWQGKKEKKHCTTHSLKKMDAYR